MKMGGEDHHGVFAAQHEGIQNRPQAFPTALSRKDISVLGHDAVTPSTLLVNGQYKSPELLFRKAHFLPAGLFGEPVKGNSSVATRTFEKSLDAVMPVVVVVILHARLQRLEVGVVTLSGRRKSCDCFPSTQHLFCGLGTAEYPNPSAFSHLEVPTSLRSRMFFKAQGFIYHVIWGEPRVSVPNTSGIKLVNGCQSTNIQGTHCHKHQIDVEHSSKACLASVLMSQSL